MKIGAILLFKLTDKKSVIVTKFKLIFNNIDKFMYL